MSSHLAVQPHGRFQSLAERLIELIYFLYDDALDYLWSLVTKKSKLERMLEKSGNIKGSSIVEIEDFLLRKLNVSTNKIFRSADDCDVLLTNSNVSTRGENREKLKQRLHSVIKVIDAYEELHSQVEATRREKYDPNNQSHEEKLQELWKLLVPYEPLESRTGKQWRYLGFQGDDPATDFRGMGILSLDQLLYLAKNYPGEIQQMLNISHHPKIGFPLAVAGITFTAVTRQLLSSGKLKPLFYKSNHEIDLDLFNETYCKIFIAFVSFWKNANPDSIMQFNTVRASFEQKLLAELSKEGCEIESIA